MPSAGLLNFAVSPLVPGITAKHPARHLIDDPSL
jgi:hypothetical protein